MSVFGVDLGNLYAKVSVARRRGIDIIINEVSKRETSTYVSFGNAEEGRMIGEKGADMKIRNFKNTVTQLKRMLGMKFDSPQWQAEQKHCMFKTSADHNGFVQAEVTVQGEHKVFSPEQMIAMMLCQLRSYADREATEDSKLGGTVRVLDCVVACPAYFSAFQRKLLFQATEIAGLNCLSLITEGTSVALQYGIFKTESLPELEENGIIVCFVDVGHSATEITTVKFWKGNLRVLSHDYDRDLGCREFDFLLADYFRGEIQAKYKMDVYEQKKAKVRLLAGCEKLRYTLSANPNVTLNVECIMDDTDISIPYSRKEFDELSAPLWERLEKLVAKAVGDRDIETVHAVELVGGGSYMPKVKDILGAAFKKHINTTLNASEAVAKGCGIMGAMLSPRFHVKEFNVFDALVHPINIGYNDPNTPPKAEVSFIPAINKQCSVFPANHNSSKDKKIKLQRNAPFDLYSFYKEPNQEVLEQNGSLLLGHWTFSDLPVAKNEKGEEMPGQPVWVEVSFRLNSSGLVFVDAATVTETYEVQEVVEQKKAKEEKKEGEEAKAETEQVTVTKTKTNKIDVKVTTNFIHGLPQKIVDEYAMLERKMETDDLHIAETLDAKNSLEAYSYEFRSKAEEGGVLYEYMPADARDKFKAACDATADWVYGEGENATKEEYVNKLKALRAPGDAAVLRMRSREELPAIFQSAKALIQKQMDEANKIIGTETHIEKAKLQEIISKALAAYEALTAEEKAVKDTPLHVDLPTTRAKIEGRANEVVVFAKPIFATPKPTPPKEEKKEEAKDEKTEKKADGMDVDP